jgi:hypothetical protein
LGWDNKEQIKVSSSKQRIKRPTRKEKQLYKRSGSISQKN